MTGRIVIHAGDCKTGSTALQAALADGRVLVDGQAPCYPAVLNHNLIAQGLLHGRPGTDARFAALLARIAASPAPLGVVSAEHFEFTDPALLAAALDRALGPRAAEVRVLAYVRPHGARALSSFAEMVKLGEWRDGLEPFLARALARGLYHYAPRFARWRAVFGDRFTLRLYQRDALQDGDLVADALAAMAPGAAVSITPAAAENESLALPALAALQGLHRQLQGHLPPALRRDAAARKAAGSLGRALAAELGPALPGDRLVLSRAQADGLVAAYRADAAALDAAFFADRDAPMTRALLTLPGAAATQAPDLNPARHLTPAARHQLTVWAGAAGRLIAADPAHFAWAARDPARRTDGPPGARRRGGAGPAADAPDRLAHRATARLAGPDSRPDSGPDGNPASPLPPDATAIAAAGRALITRLAAADPAHLAAILRAKAAPRRTTGQMAPRAAPRPGPAAAGWARRGALALVRRLPGGLQRWLARLWHRLRG